MGIPRFSSSPNEKILLTNAQIFLRTASRAKMAPLNMCLLEFIGRDGQKKEGHFDHSMTVSDLPSKGKDGKGAYVKGNNEFKTELVYVDDSCCELHMLDNHGKRMVRKNPCMLIVQREDNDIVGMDMVVTGSKFCARFGVQSKSHAGNCRPTLERFETFSNDEIERTLVSVDSVLEI